MTRRAEWFGFAAPLGFLGPLGCAIAIVAAVTLPDFFTVHPPPGTNPPRLKGDIRAATVSASDQVRSVAVQSPVRTTDMRSLDRGEARRSEAPPLSAVSAIAGIAPQTLKRRISLPPERVPVTPADEEQHILVIVPRDETSAWPFAACHTWDDLPGLAHMTCVSGPAGSSTTLLLDVTIPGEIDGQPFYVVGEPRSYSVKEFDVTNQSAWRQTGVMRYAIRAERIVVRPEEGTR